MLILFSDDSNSNQLVSSSNPMTFHVVALQKGNKKWNKKDHHVKSTFESNAIKNFDGQHSTSIRITWIPTILFQAKLIILTTGWGHFHLLLCRHHSRSSNYCHLFTFFIHGSVLNKWAMQRAQFAKFKMQSSKFKATTISTDRRWFWECFTLDNDIDADDEPPTQQQSEVKQNLEQKYNFADRDVVQDRINLQDVAILTYTESRYTYYWSMQTSYV
jgi:hypothetical protein